MTDRELMQQALEKLEFFGHMKSVSKDTQELITTLRGRLAQPEQEPVAWMYVNEDGECEQIEYGNVWLHPGVIPLYAGTKIPEDISCKTHPDAPHGFDRHMSHTLDRYVCECEYWEPSK